MLDGKENVKSHEDNTVINMIQEKFKVHGDPKTFETTFGTIAIVGFKPI